jgi:hypothetical protein
MEAAADSAPGVRAPTVRSVVDRAFACGGAIALLLASALIWLAAWWVRGWISAWPRFQDDAFYYLVIARNAAAGHGFSMDQLSATNGFQPLWQWLLVAVAWLCGGDTELLLGAAQVVSVVLFAAAIGVLCGLARRWLGPEAAVLVALFVLLPRFLNVALSGMESSLVILVEAVLLVEVVRSRVLTSTEPTWQDARSGALLGLFMLARLDGVFVLLAFAVQIALHGLRHGSGGFAARLGRVVAKGFAVYWPVLLLVLPYLAWNQLVFGHLVPISGALKTSFPTPGWSPGHLPIEHVGLLGLGFSGAAVAWLAGRRGDPLVRALAVLCVGLSAHALFTIVYMRWAIFSWHFAAFLPAGALGAALFVNALATRVPRPAIHLLLLLLLGFQVVTQAFSISRLNRTFTTAGREAGSWVARELPPDAILGMKDSGIFTYFAERRVVNLDGVANSFDYQRALCAGELERHLHERGVQYIAQHSVPPPVRIGAYETFVQIYPCRLPGGSNGRLELRRDLEVFRGTPYANDAGRLDQLFIWRLVAPPPG